MTTAFSLFGFIAQNYLSGSIPTEIGILIDLVFLKLVMVEFKGIPFLATPTPRAYGYSHFVLFSPLSGSYYNTIIIHRHVVPFL
jgi:hypothetical protein